MTQKKNSPRILIQFPTLGRPKQFKKVFRRYLDLIDNKKDFLFNIICEADDETMCKPTMIDWIYDQVEDIEDNLILEFIDSSCKHEACNWGTKALVRIKKTRKKRCDIIILASDDMVPEVQGYDNIIRDAFAGHFPDFDGVLHFHDGFQGERLNTLCILGYKYYRRFGYIYSEEQKMIYGDDEFDQVSRILGRRVWIDRVIIRHCHPGAGHKDVEYDKTYQNNDKWQDHDFKAFMRRKNNNFGLPKG